MTHYSYEGLNGLEKELGNTAVISEQFKGVIWSYVFKACQEAHAHGRKEEREKWIGEENK